MNHPAMPGNGIRRAVMIAVIATALTVTGCSSPTPAPPESPTPSSTAEAGLDAETTTALQSALDDTRELAGFPGTIARVITPEGTWTGTSGTAGPDTDAAPTATDFTRIGSVTKTMTGTVLLQLVDEGLIGLEDPVSQYVPDAPNGTATIRQVADMTSGIPSYSTDQGWQDQYFGAPDTVYTPQELLDIAKSLPVSFAPGEGWEYSNTNYVILGMIAEQLTGQPIEELFQERLFDPLDMTSSSFPGDSAKIGSPHLSGITQQGQPEETTAVATDWDPSYTFAAGEVISTLDDLEKWGHALFTGEGILSPEMQQLRRDSILTSPPPNTPTAGYGIAIGNRNGWWGHTGEIPGYNTTLFHDYESGTTIIVIVNSDIGLPDDGGNPAPAVQAALIEALGQ
jgi:D-alanyl-D-alanine carboxypeptidase